MENHSTVEVAFALSMPMVMIVMEGVVEEDGIEEMEAEADKFLTEDSSELIIGSW